MQFETASFADRCSLIVPQRILQLASPRIVIGFIRVTWESDAI